MDTVCTGVESAGPIGNLTSTCIKNIRYHKIIYDVSKDLNQNNIKDLTPFKNYKDNDNVVTLYILQDFYEKLSAYPFIMNNINNYYGKLTDYTGLQPPNGISTATLGGIYICKSLPKIESNDDTGYWIVYRAWCRMYNADIWYSVFGNLVEIVSLTSEEHNILKSCHKLTEDIIQKPVISNFLIRLNYQIGLLQKNSGQQELFIKTSAKSTKHDVKVQPITNGAEALNYLLSSPTIQGVLSRNEPVELLLRPWNTEVNNDNEIRVFIQDSNIKAVSQQYIYASSPVLGMMFQYNGADILDKITGIWQQIQTHTKYTDAVLDMFITGDGEVELIEVNCGGNGWGPAGSSLFKWHEINAIEPGTCVFAYY